MTTFKTLHFDYMMWSINRYSKNKYLEVGKSCSILANHRLVISCRAWLTFRPPHSLGTRKSIRDFRKLFCVTRCSSSAACHSGEREGYTLHILESVADGERRPQAREPVEICAGECQKGSAEWLVSSLAIVQYIKKRSSITVYTQAVIYIKMDTYFDCTYVANFRLDILVGPWTKCKTIPILSWRDPEGSRSLRLPNFKTIGTWGWEECQPYILAAFIHRKCSWYSFLLEVESNPGP
jgi:hypothetical protein